MVRMRTLKYAWIAFLGMAVLNLGNRYYIDITNPVDEYGMPLNCDCRFCKPPDNPEGINYHPISKNKD